MPRHSAPRRRRPGDLLVRAGAALFLVGAVGALVAVVPFVTGSSDDAPLAVTLVALLLPVGFALALLGLLRSSRAHE